MDLEGSDTVQLPSPHTTSDTSPSSDTSAFSTSIVISHPSKNAIPKIMLRSIGRVLLIVVCTLIITWYLVVLIISTNTINETSKHQCSTSLPIRTQLETSTMLQLCQARFAMAHNSRSVSGLFSCIVSCKFDQSSPCDIETDGAIFYDLHDPMCMIALSRTLEYNIKSPFLPCTEVSRISRNLTEALLKLLDSLIDNDYTMKLNSSDTCNVEFSAYAFRTPYPPKVQMTDNIQETAKRLSAVETLRRLQFMGLDQLSSQIGGGSQTSLGSLGDGWDLDFASIRETKRKMDEDVDFLVKGIEGDFEPTTLSRVAGTKSELFDQLDNILGGQQFGDLAPVNVDQQAFQALYPDADDDDTRYSKHLLDFMPDVYNKVVWDQWAADASRNIVRREYQARVGNDLAFGGGGIGILTETINTNVGVRRTYVSTYLNDLTENIGISVLQGDYGVSLNRSNDARAQVAEVMARGVRTATIVDLADRNYGQRIKIRDFDIMMRHDFDEYWQPVASRPATSGYLIYRDVSLAVQADIAERLVGVGVAYRTVQASAIANLSNGWISAEASVGRGWHGQVTLDVPDQYSSRVFMRAGLGVLGRSYVGAGAGISDEGLPMFSAEAQLGNVVYGLDWIQDSLYPDRMVAHQTMSIGRFTYIWDSHMWPDEVPSAKEAVINKFGAIAGLINNITNRGDSSGSITSL